MPDPEILSERIEANGGNPSRQPINDLIGTHDFVESEFAPGSGRCDRCGGGPLAEIHLKKMDPLERIADYLIQVGADSIVERTALVIPLRRSAEALERIAGELERIAQAQGFSFGNVLGWLIWMVICGGAGVWIGLHLH